MLCRKHSYEDQIHAASEVSFENARRIFVAELFGVLVELTVFVSVA